MANNKQSDVQKPILSSPVFSVKFIHIGHHKAGSTFIQNEVLKKIRSLQQMPGKRADGLSNTELRRAWINMIQCNDLFYNSEPVIKAFSEVAFNCLSNEGFVGFGSLEASHGNHISQCARRLRTMFGETRILFVIRNQRDVIRSYYVDDIEYGYTISFRKWMENRRFNRQLDWFRYAPTIELYRELFGKANVKVVLYEELFHKETFAEIFRDFNVDSSGLEDVDFSKRINEGMNGWMLAGSLVVNRLIGTRANMGNGFLYRIWIDTIRHKIGKLGRLLGSGKPKLDYPEFEETLVEIFGADNRRAGELIGIDLASRGYPL